MFPESPGDDLPLAGQSGEQSREEESQQETKELGLFKQILSEVVILTEDLLGCRSPSWPCAASWPTCPAPRRRRGSAGCSCPSCAA